MKTWAIWQSTTLPYRQVIALFKSTLSQEVDDITLEYGTFQSQQGSSLPVIQAPSPFSLLISLLGVRSGFVLMKNKNLFPGIWAVRNVITLESFKALQIHTRADMFLGYHLQPPHLTGGKHKTQQCLWPMSISRARRISNWHQLGGFLV